MITGITAYGLHSLVVLSRAGSDLVDRLIRFQVRHGDFLLDDLKHSFWLSKLKTFRRCERLSGWQQVVVLGRSR